MGAGNINDVRINIDADNQSEAAFNRVLDDINELMVDSSRATDALVSDSRRLARTQIQDAERAQRARAQILTQQARDEAAANLRRIRDTLGLSVQERRLQQDAVRERLRSQQRIIQADREINLERLRNARTSIQQITAEELRLGAIRDRQSERFRRQLQRNINTLRRLRNITAIFGGFGAFELFRFSVNQALQIDNARNSLIALGLSAQDATMHLQELRILARQPGVTYQQAVRASVDLRSLNIVGDQALNLISQIGNALALAGSTDLSGVILPITQIAGAGQLLEQDLRQILTRIPALRPLIIQEFGSATAEGIRQGYEQAGRAFQVPDFITRLTRAAGQLGRAPADSASNAFNNLQQAVSELARVFAEQFLPELTRVSLELTDTIQNSTEVQERIRSLGQTFADFIRTLSNLNFSRVFTGLTAGVVGFGLFRLGGIFTSLIDRTVDLNTGIRTLLFRWSQFASLADRTQTIFMGLTRIGFRLAQAIRFIGASLQLISLFSFVQDFLRASRVLGDSNNNLVDASRNVAELEENLRSVGDAQRTVIQQINDLELLRLNRGLENLQRRLGSIQNSIQVFASLPAPALGTGFGSDLDTDLATLERLRDELEAIERPTIQEAGTLSIVRSIIELRGRERDILREIATTERNIRTASQARELTLQQQVDLINDYRQHLNDVLSVGDATEQERINAIRALAAANAELFRIQGLINAQANQATEAVENQRTVLRNYALELVRINDRIATLRDALTNLARDTNITATAAALRQAIADRTSVELAQVREQIQAQQAIIRNTATSQEDLLAAQRELNSLLAEELRIRLDAQRELQGVGRLFDDAVLNRFEGRIEGIRGAFTDLSNFLRGTFVGVFVRTINRTQEGFRGLARVIDRAPYVNFNRDVIRLHESLERINRLRLQQYRFDVIFSGLEDILNLPVRETFGNWTETIRRFFNVQRDELPRVSNQWGQYIGRILSGISQVREATRTTFVRDVFADILPGIRSFDVFRRRYQRQVRDNERNQREARDRQERDEQEQLDIAREALDRRFSLVSNYVNAAGDAFLELALNQQASFREVAAEFIRESVRITVQAAIEFEIRRRFDNALADLQVENIRRVRRERQAEIVQIQELANINLGGFGQLAAGGLGALGVSTAFFPQQISNLSEGIGDILGDFVGNLEDIIQDGVISLGDIQFNFDDGTSRKIYQRGRRATTRRR